MDPRTPSDLTQRERFLLSKMSHQPTRRLVDTWRATYTQKKHICALGLAWSEWVCDVPWFCCGSHVCRVDFRMRCVRLAGALLPDPSQTFGRTNLVQLGPAGPAGPPCRTSGQFSLKPQLKLSESAFRPFPAPKIEHHWPESTPCSWGLTSSGSLSNENEVPTSDTAVFDLSKLVSQGDCRNNGQVKDHKSCRLTKDAKSCKGTYTIQFLHTLIIYYMQ